MELHPVPDLVDAEVIAIPPARPMHSPGDWARYLPGTGYTCRTADAWTCVFVTPTIERLLGIAAGEWVDVPRTWLEHINPADRERVLTERLTTVTERRRFAAEYRMIHRDGSERWVRDEAHLEFREGEPALAHGLLMDVTYRHRSDAVLAELYESSRHEVRQFQQEIRERKAFIRLLAHDLRAPLTVVQGSLQTMLRLDETELDAEGRRQLAVRAESAATRCRELIHQLLEIDRWTAASTIDAQPVGLLELVEQAVQQADVTGRRVDLDVADTEVVVDAVVVTRALTNLITNAARHTPEDGVVRVRATTHRDDAILFSVEDEGPGIPDERKEQVFHPYFSLEGESESGSLGLGLALVSALAELHGGRVWVEDLPEEGAVFHLLVAGR